jgi:hypothetical protein
MHQERAVVEEDGDASRLHGRIVGVVLRLVVGLVVGYDTNGNAPIVGSNQGVDNGNPVQTVDGSVNRSTGHVEVVEQLLLHLRDSYAGAWGSDVIGEEGKGVATQGEGDGAQSHQADQYEEYEN